MKQDIKNYHKLFSIEEANKSLILVSKIVEDITNTTSQLQIQKSKLSTIEQENINQEELQYIKTTAEKLIHYYNELENLGIVLLNYHPIVIGFPSNQFNTEIDLLTWSPGQIEVTIPKQLVK